MSDLIGNPEDRFSGSVYVAVDLVTDDDNELIFHYFLYFQRCILSLGVVTTTPEYAISCEMISSQSSCQTIYRNGKPTSYL